MKRLTLILIFICLSCSSDTSHDSNSLFGQWRLVEVKKGFPSEWKSAEHSYTLVLNTDGSFTSTKFQECETGTFTYNENELSLIYDCLGFSAGIESPPGTFVETYNFDKKHLILTPKYMNCVEGCSYKFKKASN